MTELKEKALAIYEQKENEIGEPIRELERVVVLKIVDSKWMDHIDAMDELKNGIGLRAYGQKDPVVQYRFEGGEMFDEMNENISEDTARAVLSVIPKPQVIKREAVAKETNAGLMGSSSGEKTVKKPVKKDVKVGRNDPCPCGSGKKYKKCCGMNENSADWFDRVKKWVLVLYLSAICLCSALLRMDLMFFPILLDLE